MKGRKLIIFGLITLAAAVILAGCAAMTGAFKKDTWTDANAKIRIKQGLHAVPVEREINLSADDAKNLKIIASGDATTINYGNVTDINIRYYEDYEGQDVAVIDKGSETLVIDRKLKTYFNLGFDWLINWEMYKIDVVLPDSMAFMGSKISVSGGSLDIKNVKLGEISKITVSGGKMDLGGCEIESINEISISGGNVSLKEGVIKDLNKITINGGSMYAAGITSSDLDVKISGGKLTLQNSGLGAGISSTVYTKNSGGSAEYIDCNITGKFEGIISGGHITVSGGSVSGNVSYKLSGGVLNMDNLRNVGNLAFPSVSGGSVNLTGFPHAANDIAFDTKVSGGRIILNGTKIEEGRQGSSSPSCTVEAKLSGGKIKITTV